jgi:hypothetical protein
MTGKVFEAALGIADPWLVASVDFDETAKVLTVLIDFKPGSRFAVSGHQGAHPGLCRIKRECPKFWCAGQNRRDVVNERVIRRKLNQPRRLRVMHLQPRGCG